MFVLCCYDYYAPAHMIASQLNLKSPIYFIAEAPSNPQLLKLPFNMFKDVSEHTCIMYLCLQDLQRKRRKKNLAHSLDIAHLTLNMPKSQIYAPHNTHKVHRAVISLAL